MRKIFSTRRVSALVAAIVFSIGLAATTRSADAHEGSDGKIVADDEVIFCSGCEPTGSSAQVTLVLQVSPSYAGALIDNSAEISIADDDTDDMNGTPTDLDSDPDQDDENDTDGGDRRGYAAAMRFARQPVDLMTEVDPEADRLLLG